MKKAIIDWLLEGPSWIRYATELQLLDLKPDPEAALKDPQIAEILDRLKDSRSGIPAIQKGHMSSDEYGNPYWDLFFLADLGLTAADLGLKKEIEVFLDSQAANGTYVTEMGMQPSYFCKSVILLSAIAKMDFRNDPHILKLVRLFLSSQRLDGGWYCNPNHDIGSALEDESSCPQDNLNILLLLGQYDEYRHDSRFNGAIDLLLGHWAMRDSGIQLVYFGVGKRYRAMQYPATRYGILRVLDAISLYPYAFKKASFHNMLEFVQRKAVDGRYQVEIRTPYTDLERQSELSRLITFIVSRIEKRVDQAG